MKSAASSTPLVAGSRRSGWSRHADTAAIAMRTADAGVRPWHAAAFAAMALVYIGLGLATVAWRRLTGDEGWYTFAAIQVLSGRVPYRDFLFTQTPAVPYVYAAWLAVAGYSLLAARLLSFAFGGLGVVFTVLAAHRAAGVRAALLAGVLLVGNLSFLFEVCSVRTQALTVLLSALTVWSATYADEAWSTPVCFGAAAALVCTRLSMLPVLPLVWTFALIARPRRSRTAAWIAASAALPAAVVAALGSGPSVWFGTVGFHREWYGNARWNVPLFYDVMLRGFLANQWPIVVAVAGALALVVRRRVLAEDFAEDLHRARWWLGFLAASYGATTAIHFSRPIAYPTYQASNMVFAVVFAAFVWARLCARIAAARWVTGSLMVPMMLCALPFQDFIVDRSGDGGLGKVNEVVRFVQAAAEGQEPILTPSTEIAVESGLPLAAGWEMGEFAWFPRMDDERARALHVVNRAMLWRDLSEARFPLVCFTERQINMMGASDLRSLLAKRYVLRRTFANYGQFVEPLYVFTRR